MDTTGLHSRCSCATMQVELSGLIPPWTVDRLCTACAAAQGGAFRAVLDTLPASACLNAPPPKGDSKFDGVATAAVSSLWGATAGCDCKHYGLMQNIAEVGISWPLIKLPHAEKTGEDRGAGCRLHQSASCQPEFGP